MVEMIDIFTKQGEKIGTISKKDYYSLTCADKDIPWIRCVSCFVIDDVSKEILWEKRGKRFLDSGKLDLCSGHVQSGEIPLQGMVRELDEELSIGENDSRNLQYLGEIKVDYTTLEDETNRKRLKALVSIYALRLRMIEQIAIDHKEVISKGYLNYDDSIAFIQNGMTRMPYERFLKPQYDTVFENLKEIMFPRKDSRIWKKGVNMRFGIDIDDVITDTSDSMREYIEKYDNTRDVSQFMEEVMRGEIPTQNVKDFLDEHIISILQNAKVKKHASEVMHRLIDDGDEIYLITSRGEEKYKGSRKTTLQYLKENDIPYTKILFDCFDKARICKYNKIEVMVDDSPKYCMEVLREGMRQCFI